MRSVVLIQRNLVSGPSKNIPIRLDEFPLSARQSNLEDPYINANDILNRIFT